MTAEVVALNKSAAAMAADSKGTVRINGTVKTHDTVNKLFTLSKYHPVGVMIYGNAEMMGTPWETAIKVYRDRLRDKCFSKLSRYGHDFVSCLHLDYPSSASNQDTNVYWMARDFVKILVAKAEGIIDDAPGVDPNIVLRSVLDNAIEAKDEALVLRNFRDITAEELRKMYSGSLVDAFKDTISVQFHKEFQEDFVVFLSDIIRRQMFSEGFTGIVFSGFGDSEIYPRAKSYIVDGIVADRSRSWISHRSVISDAMTASIKPFAQNDMVYRFMEGIDPEYRTFLEVSILGILENTLDIVVDNYVPGSKSKKAQIRKDLDDLIEPELLNFFRQAAFYRTKNFAEPIVSMAQLLPKEELAHLAESLVNLTSLKRRVSLDDESVGGPIDVAVISKGDGFVWIKRKHYFDPSLNATFMANYFRAHVNGKGEAGHERHQGKGNS